MLDNKYPSWPRRGTLCYSLARFLIAHAPSYNGRVPWNKFSNDYNATHHQISCACARLCSVYGYRCNMAGNLILCDLYWPEPVLTREWDEHGYSTPVYRVPKVSLPVVPKRKFLTIRNRESITGRIATYILRHREPQTHVLNAEWLCKEYGTARVHKKFQTLNKRYGYKITKLNKTYMWHVDKISNTQL